jgi:hypothetical protein
MLSNAIVETKIMSLEREKIVLAGRKNELSALLKQTGLTKQAFRCARLGRISVDAETFQKHEALTMEYHEVETRICELKASLKALYRQKDANRNSLVFEVLKEIFNKDQLKEINKEAGKRAAGDEPQKVLFNLNAAQSLYEDVEKWKKLYAGELDKIQEVRILLNRVIEAGCKEFGDAEFLKVISPLNRYVLPLNELKILKRKVFPRDYINK